ncbi:MAG: serine hydrolase [Anaerolineaceae bacterium]|nr:serine hydrolase [Anaerolineaceae bacterium]
MKTNTIAKSEKLRQHTVKLISILMILATLAACSPLRAELAAVDYTPQAGQDWSISSPAEQGLDPMLVAEMYHNAAQLETIYSLLVIKNDQLVAEGYFNEGTIDQKSLLQSASKSYISALIGIALDQGCLSNLDQKMMEFFPEYADQISDPRKKEITIRQLLQMRSGYPWEETDPALMEAMWAGDNPPLIVHYPLTNDPGAEFQYSNATSHWLGEIVARSCETDLKTFAEENLLSPLGAEMGEFWQDMYAGYYPLFHLTARDMAKFGLLYLNEGEYDGNQVISADWIHDSLQTYSEDAWGYRVGRNFNDIGYGYQWWSARSGEHEYNLAWGHGGQLIFLVQDLDMVIVVKSDPFWMQHDGQSWKHEKANINLVADFINALPIE